MSIGKDCWNLSSMVTTRTSTTRGQKQTRYSLAQYLYTALGWRWLLERLDLPRWVPLGVRRNDVEPADAVCRPHQRLMSG